MSSLLTEQEVAQQLNVSLAALRRWRLEGRGPRFIKVSALVRYRPDELEQWLASRPAGGTTDQSVRGRVPVTGGYRSARA